MLRSEAIQKTVEFAETQAIVMAVADGMTEEMAKAHMLVRREQAYAVIGEYLDLFVSMDYIKNIEPDPVEESEESEDTSETSEETSED